MSTTGGMWDERCEHPCEHGGEGPLRGGRARYSKRARGHPPAPATDLPQRRSELQRITKEKEMGDGRKLEELLGSANASLALREFTFLQERAHSEAGRL